MQQTPPLQPDTKLFIYCLAGTISDQPSYPLAFLGNWEEDQHSFLFFLESADSFIEGLLREQTQLNFVDKFSMTYREWQGGSLEPLKIGRFILNPPWIKASPGAGEIALRFDPGLVFGNGTHPTTFTCLTALEIACAGNRVSTMLDLGTGSGLLALAGAKLGCRRVVAVDSNLLAARTALNNVRLNGLEQKVLVVNGLAESFTSVPSDLLIANIQYPVLAAIVQSSGFIKQKWFVLSGLQAGEADALITLLRKLPVLILKRWAVDGFWHTIFGITSP